MAVSKVRESCFSLVELVIVVAIIGIIAAIAIPRVSRGSQNAKLAQLQGNLTAVRRAIEYYAADHLGRTPNIKETGSEDGSGDNFVERLVGTTDEDGKLTADGLYGPYLRTFPANPFIDKETDQAKVRIGGAAAGEGDKGWHYDPETGLFSADDSPEHALL